MCRALIEPKMDARRLLVNLAAEARPASPTLDCERNQQPPEIEARSRPLHDHQWLIASHWCLYESNLQLYPDRFLLSCAVGRRHTATFDPIQG